MAIIFKPGFFYYIKAELPITGKLIAIAKVTKRDEWNAYCDRYKRFFKSIILMEYNSIKPINERIRQVSKLTNNNFRKIIRIPRIKKDKKKPIKGNLLVKIDGDTAYIQVSHFKKRKIIKIDLEDLQPLLDVTKKSFYFIGRYNKQSKTVNYILSKKKYRPNSLYSYILKQKIFTKVIHKDGDIFNYKKDNLIVTTQRKVTAIVPNNYSEVFVEKKINELVGVIKSDRISYNYIAEIHVHGVLIKLGRFINAIDAAMAYDIARMYYYGRDKTANYPADYYFILKQDLVLKWYINLKKRKYQNESNLARELMSNMLAESQKEKDTHGNEN